MTDMSMFLERNNTIYIFSFANIKGFDIESFKIYDSKCTRWLYFQDSNFGFYKNGLQVNSCNKYLNDVKKNNFIFDDANQMYLNFGVALNKICPLYFSKANLSIFQVQRMQYSFIKNSVLLFETVNYSKTINSSILKYKIIFTERLILDGNLLNEQVFQKLEVLEVFGHIISISDNLFTNLRNLKLLKFEFSNAKNLFNRGIKWIESINWKKKI